MSAPSESWLEPPSGHSREATVRSMPSAPSRRRVKVAHADAERSSAPDSIRIESSGRTGRFGSRARAAGSVPVAGPPVAARQSPPRRPGGRGGARTRGGHDRRGLRPQKPDRDDGPEHGEGREREAEDAGGQAHGDSIGPDRRRAGPGAGIVGPRWAGALPPAAPFRARACPAHASGTLRSGDRRGETTLPRDAPPGGRDAWGPARLRFAGTWCSSRSRRSAGTPRGRWRAPGRPQRVLHLVDRGRAGRA